MHEYRVLCTKEKNSGQLHVDIVSMQDRDSAVTHAQILRQRLSLSPNVELVAPEILLFQEKNSISIRYSNNYLQKNIATRGRLLELTPFIRETFYDMKRQNKTSTLKLEKSKTYDFFAQTNKDDINSLIGMELYEQIKYLENLEKKRKELNDWYRTHPAPSIMQKFYASLGRGD